VRARATNRSGKKLSGRSLRSYVKNRTEFYLLRSSHKKLTLRQNFYVSFRP